MSFGSLVFTPLVKKLQERYGSRRQYERMENSGGSQDRFTPFETEFLAQRDSFYWATTGDRVALRPASRWPQGFPQGDRRSHPGVRGFSRKQAYISTGNLLTDNRVAIIMVDYPRQARLKILGRVEILEGERQRVGWTGFACREKRQSSREYS